jgi:hypothetical protein
LNVRLPTAIEPYCLLFRRTEAHSTAMSHLEIGGDKRIYQ